MWTKNQPRDLTARLQAVETWPTQQRNKNFVRMALSSSFFASEQSAIVTKPSGGRIVISSSTAPVHKNQLRRSPNYL